MLKKFQNLESITLPEELRQVLVRLENGGMISPILFGGAIRDTVTGYKPVNDYDLRIAGFENKQIQTLTESLLQTAPTDQEGPRPIIIPDSFKKYFLDQFGIRITGGELRPDSLKIKGMFAESAWGPSIDLGITKQSLHASSETIKQNMAKKADATLVAVAVDPQGQVYGHKNFEQDALNNEFRIVSELNLSTIHTRVYYERLKEKLPDLRFNETPLTITHGFLKNSTPSVFNLLKQTKNNTINALSAFSTMVTGKASSKAPWNPPTIRTKNETPTPTPSPTET